MAAQPAAWGLPGKLVLASVLALTGCASPLPSGVTATQAHPSARAPEFSIVALPDTQYYAAAHPEILRAQVKWIAAEQAARRITAVVHEGDIVDDDQPEQWLRASESLRLLDGVVPCILGTGNHDYARSGKFLTRASLIDRYFSDPPAAPGLVTRGLFEPGHVENSSQVIDTPGGAWLILSLEFGPRDAVLAWAGGVLRAHEDLPAILVTHAYLRADNARHDHAVETAGWNPHRYLDDRAPGAVNDGEEIWRKLVVDNPSILFVLCGHELGDGVARLTSLRPDGTRVHQILANYQMGPLGGGGYLRVMRFQPQRRQVEVRTYSPFLDRFKTDADNAFVLDY